MDETKPPIDEKTVIAEYPPSDGQNWECQCARCGSSCDSQKCYHCGGEGLDGHNCGEDCCCCLYPEDNVTCDICRGHGHWYACLSSSEFCQANPLPGRENVKRGEIEWFVVKEPA